MKRLTELLLPQQHFPREDVPRFASSLLLVGFGFACAAAIANLGTGGRVQGVNMVLPTLVIVAALMLDRTSAVVWSVRRAGKGQVMLSQERTA